MAVTARFRLGIVLISSALATVALVPSHGWHAFRNRKNSCYSRHSSAAVGVAAKVLFQIKEGHSESGFSEATTPLLSTTKVDVALFSPWELWCAQQLKRKYEQALSIKCPFFRRRAADFLDASDMVIRFIVYRHKSLPFSPPGWKCQNDDRPKQIGISQSELLATIRRDWREDTNKGYYITGKLTTMVYRDDVIFDGPDPDMPVRGLRKYLNAASQLFEHSKSRSELLSLEILSIDEGDVNNFYKSKDNAVIVARWKMQGVLRLPWKPAVPEWTGTTTYYIDQDGLIYRHEETWDKSVLRAFLETLCPVVANRIWAQG